MAIIINPNKSFTIHDKRDINTKINSDLNIITDILLTHFSNIESLVLAGSFGRGEGSVLIHNNVIQPINDYDIYIITKDHTHNINLESLRKILSDKIQIRQVDIEVIQLKKLKDSLFKI